MKKIFYILSILILSCNQNKNNKIEKIEDFDVVKKQGNHLTLKHKYENFLIKIDTINNNKIALNFFDKDNNLIMVNLFKNDSLYFYPAKLEGKLFGKGKVSLKINENGLFYNGWIKTIDKNEYSLLKGKVRTKYGVNMSQFITLNDDNSIGKDSYYYKIISKDDNHIKFYFKTLNPKTNIILRNYSNLVIMDDSNSYLKRIDTIKIDSGVNTIKRSIIENNKYSLFLETNSLYKDSTIETIVLIPFDTINELPLNL